MVQFAVVLERYATPEVTSLLRAWANGDSEAFDQLMPIVYKELLRIARARMSRERQEHTLQPTALVNEAYMRLINVRQVQWRDRAHFFAIASEAMRRVLVDHSRARGYAKRAGGRRIQLEEATAAPAQSTDLLDLDQAISDLSKIDARKARITELRFFGGLNVEEIAVVLGVSSETVHRDWRMSKSWLRRQMCTLATSRGETDVD